MKGISTAFRDLHRRGKTYPRGVVTLEGGVARLEAGGGGRLSWLRRRRPATFLEPITIHTPVHADPPSLTIGDSTFVVPDPEALGRLIIAAYEPRARERLRRRKLVQEAASAVALFLSERGRFLVEAQRLASEPRSTLAEYVKDENVVDPVESFREEKSRAFREAYAAAMSGIGGVAGDLGEGGARRVHAAVYAAGKAQDASFLSDGALFGDAIALAERALGRTLRAERLTCSSISEITETLCAEIEDAMPSIFDDAGERASSKP